MIKYQDICFYKLLICRVTGIYLDYFILYILNTSFILSYYKWLIDF